MFLLAALVWAAFMSGAMYVVFKVAPRPQPIQGLVAAHAVLISGIVGTGALVSSAFGWGPWS